jgi:N-acetylglucosamine-6-phosphate deacetylase
MATMAREGTTRVLLTTVAGPIERLEAVLAQGAAYASSERNGCDGTELFGAFVEGTFIRNADYAGAQNADYFTTPSRELFDRLNDAASGTIRYVNIVPEYGSAALDLTGYLSARGVLVGAGHVSCSAEMYQRAVERGLRIAVHFTNGPTGSSFKPFGGGSVLQSVLTSHRVFVELIGDGYHVNPSYLLDIMARKGPERVVAVTDAMFVAGAPEITTFEVSGIKGAVSETGDYLKVVEKENTLFGSMLTMRVAFANWVSWLTRQMPGIWVDEHDPLSLDEAILAASHFCATNPARVLGVLDPVSRHLGQKLDGFVGSLEVGKRADVVLLRLNGSPGQYRAAVRSVFVKGRKVV